MSHFTLGKHELSIVTQAIDEALPQGGVVLLRGDLSAGKTTLVQHYVKNKNIGEDVTSPTFSLQHQYGDALYHYDIYNSGLEKFMSLGMLEELSKEGIHFIEWGDEALQNILQSAGFNVCIVNIEKIDDATRCYEVIDA